MSASNPNYHGTAFEELIDADRLCELGPGSPNRAVYNQLKSLHVETAFGTDVVDHDMAACCISGVWLLHDFLDESHTISQEVLTNTGSYWHAIMHRREPDYSNAKYWFRRVGDHAVYQPLANAARELAGAASDDRSREMFSSGEWDPFRFVDLCEAATLESTAAALCRKVAQAEWSLLFDFCYRQAIGVN